MSAVNVIQFPDGIHLATDSAAWDLSGVITSFVPKSFAIPHFPAIIATRGAAITPLLFGWTFTKEFSDFDDLVAHLEDEMPEIHERLMPELEGQNFDLIIVGYSAQRQVFETYSMTTFGIEDRGYSDEEAEAKIQDGVQEQAPYALVKIDLPLFVAPAVFEDEIAATGLNQRAAKLGRQAQIDETFRTILELQRQKPFNFAGCDEPFHGIGGWATCATVTKDGIEQRIIHRWQDKVGDLIKPTPIEWNVPTQSNLATVTPISTAPTFANRQQRRAWERQQKKAKRLG